MKKHTGRGVKGRQVVLRRPSKEKKNSEEIPGHGAQKGCRREREQVLRGTLVLPERGLEEHAHVIERKEAFLG